MNVIDVTPRPAAVTAVVRFLQSPFMSILGILFILTALKWGTLLFVVPQYETVIITRLCRTRTIADTAAGRGVTSITFMGSSSVRRAPEAATSGECSSGCHPR